MKKILLTLGTVAAVAAPVATVVACGSAATDTVAYVAYNGAKITKDNTVFVTDGGSLKDKTFNQSVYEGAKSAGMSASTEHAISAASSAAIGDAYVTAKSKHSSLIVASGFNHGTAMTEFSQEHSDMGFVFVDGTLEAVKKDGTKAQQGNVASIVFATEQAAFEEGVAAAASSAKSVHHKIGVYGGMDIPSVNSYIKGLKAGVEFYNNNLTAADGQKVTVEDAGFVGNFKSGGASMTKATTLVGHTDIVMAVGGPQYTDVASAITAEHKEALVKLIGVDVDITNVMDTATKTFVFGSVTKGLKSMTNDVVTAIYADNGAAEFGVVKTGTIANTGVGITNDADLVAAVADMDKTKVEIEAAAQAYTI